MSDSKPKPIAELVVSEDIMVLIDKVSQYVSSLENRTAQLREQLVVTQDENETFRSVLKNILSNTQEYDKEPKNYRDREKSMMAYQLWMIRLMLKAAVNSDVGSDEDDK